MSYTDKLSTGMKLFMIKEQHNDYREYKNVYEEKVHVTTFCSRKFIINLVSVRKMYVR